MSSAEDYQVQNVYKYSRKSYKKNRRTVTDDGGSPREDGTEVAESAPRSRTDGFSDPGGPGCSCDQNTESDLANTLHKKCTVVYLAQHQLQKLLEGTDRLLCDNTRCCKSVYDFFCICKEMLMSQNKAQCALMLLIVFAFFTGIMVGAATCGAYLGRFNSPILSCIEDFFVRDSFGTIQESFRSIA